MAKRNSKLCFLGIVFLACIPQALLVKPGIPWPYSTSAHYWPLDKDTGLFDAIAKQTGSHHGQANSIKFEGPGKGHLYVHKGVRVVLGTFRDQCIVDPSKCRTYLTVSLWLRYTPRKKNSKQFIIGTEAGFSTPGFSIHYVPHKSSQKRTIIKVNQGNTVWAGSLNITSEDWTQVAFSWSNSSGLVLYKNCKQVTGHITGQKIPGGLGIGRRNSKDNHLYLTKAPGQGKGASKISYDDIAVWYNDVMSSPNRSFICSSKIDSPRLQSNCTVGGRWMHVTWVPPAAQYDALTGYEVWYRYPGSSWGRQRTDAAAGRMANITGLKPHSSLEIRVQNIIRSNIYGRTSNKIVCNTTKIVLGEPVNVIVAATSSRAILLKWDTPKDHEAPKGFRIFYKLHGSQQEYFKLDVGPLKMYLISGLTKNSRYRMQIMAYGDKHHTNSVPVEVTASTAKDDLRSVLSVHIDMIGPNALNVSWSTPIDPYARYWYQVFMQWTQGDREQMIEVYKGKKNMCSVRIRMEQIPFPKTFSVMAHVESVIPPRPIKGPVTNVTLRDITWKSVVITWQPPPGFPTKYLLDVKYIVELNSGGKRRKHMTRDTRLRVLGLRQLKRYTLNIRAVNRAGKGPKLSKEIDIKTEDLDECGDASGGNCEPRDKDDFMFGDSCIASSFTCPSTSICVNTKGSFYCKCGTGYIGDGTLCRELSQDYEDTDFCPDSFSQNITWSRTLRGEADVTSCPDGVTGIARRKCVEGIPGQSASWDVPDLSECVSQWALNMKEQALDPNIKPTSIASQMVNLTNTDRLDEVYPGDLTAVVDVIGVLSQREGTRSKKAPAKESEEFTKLVVNTASNILDSQAIDKWTYIPTGKRKNQAGLLMSNLDSVALQMAQATESGVAAMPNVVLGVRSTVNHNASEPIGFRESAQEKSDGKAGNMVMFPSSEMKRDGTPQYATYVSYNTLGSLLSANGHNTNSTINSAVVSLTLKPLKRRVFKEPVTIVLSHSNADGMFGNASCVFWNMSSSSWSDEGCHVNATNSTHTVCQCYHLTGFAILMNVQGNPAQLISGDHRLALSLITYIGIVLSVVALCIALFTFVTFRFLKSSRTFMHKNLAIALILAQLLFLFGVNKTEIKLACQIIAGAMHYMWLASFSWMALEGVMLYLMLVKVFGTKTITNKKRIVFLAVGWGLPAIVVAVAAGINPQGYGTKYYCWLSMENGFIWSFVGPALTVIAFNFVFMGITFSVMSRRGGHRRKPSKIRKIRYWAKACTLLTCILGLTWLFGVFYVNNETLFMAYFFTIFNSLQGVFIFLFHCLGDEKIRREYLRVLCCREKGPAYTSTSSKSSKSDSTAKMIKSSENGESTKSDKKGLKFTDASAGFSMDGQKPVLVMFQRRTSPGHRGPSQSEENDTDSHRSSQRMSGEIVMNPRDSLASFTSFQLHQNRNSARYSLVSNDMNDTLGRQQQAAGGLSVVVELPNNVTEEATHV